MYIFFINPETSSGSVISSPVGQESSSSASKTSDEKFRVTKTLFSIDSMLSSKETLSWLMRLLSVVGLMTMMRGTPWGDLGPVGGIFPKFRQSKESLLWLFILSQILPFSPQASEIALVRLWLRLLVRTRRGRAAMVRELETSSWSQALDGSLMTDGCWECQKVNTYMRKSPSDHGCVMFYYIRASSVNRRWIKDNIVSFQIHTFTFFCSVSSPSLLCGFWLSSGLTVFYRTSYRTDCVMICFWRNRLTSCPEAPSPHPSITASKK